MNKEEQKRKSKFLSLVLRHRPEQIGIELDEGGWVEVDLLLDRLKRHGKNWTREQLETVVRENDKQRFIFDDSETRIRANQGHSIDVKLDYESAEPPETLLHGTPEKFVSAIRKSGLKKMRRHHVHLHADETIASAVGQRRGKAVVLRIRAGEMHSAGHEFFVTPNQVWLVESVPAQYIDFPE
jgi:putative RNA 2'-phosphotransferase